VTAAGAGRRVEFAIDAPTEPLVVCADRDRLHQVFANLLDNATRHSPAGGTVTVSARRVGGGGPSGKTQPDQVAFEVADEGTGIPVEQQARVFERFTGGSRGDYRNAAASRDGGTGLGLAIAQWVVDLHGGTIEVAQSSQPGCRIRVTLPR
jgi:signal transduction histidine kinase